MASSFEEEKINISYCPGYWRQCVKRGGLKTRKPGTPYRAPGLHVLILTESLCFSDAEHLGAAARAGTLGGRLAVLHLHGLGIGHFLLFAAFHAVCLHLFLL